MKVEDIKTICVVGAGFMGHGIAQTFAQKGYRVNMTTRREETLQQAQVKIKANVERMTENGLMSQDEARAVSSNLNATTDRAEAVKNADFVIETLKEDPNLKKQIFSEINGLCPKHAIFATNTSSISIADLAPSTGRADRFVGMHWWNPPHLMPLVEVFKGPQTSYEFAQITLELVNRLGRVPVTCKDNPGFLGVRIQAAILLESIRILEEGIASAEDIDTAVRMTLGLRLPIMGPLQIIDLGGMDTFYYAYDYLGKHLADRFIPPSLLKNNAEQGKLGIKTGEGFHSYTPEKIQEIVKKRDKWLIERVKEIYQQR